MRKARTHVRVSKLVLGLLAQLLEFLCCQCFEPAELRLCQRRRLRRLVRR